VPDFLRKFQFYLRVRNGAYSRKYMSTERSKKIEINQKRQTN